MARIVGSALTVEPVDGARAKRQTLADIAVVTFLKTGNYCCFALPDRRDGDASRVYLSLISLRCVVGAEKEAFSRVVLADLF